MDYIRNSKNRKLKKQILSFLSRLNFGAYRLELAGKTILLCVFFLFVSLFFPWVSLHSDLVKQGDTYTAFSLYVGGIGYGMLFAIVGILFFLLSHEKKEYLRGYVPFRLSDAQAIVFIDSMLIISLVHTFLSFFAYTKMSTQKVDVGVGMEIALTACMILLIAAYFFSKGEKSRAVTMSYLDKKEDDDDVLGEYRDILAEKKKNPDEKNMTLPI